MRHPKLMRVLCVLALTMPLIAQPKIGVVEIYGAGKISRDKIQKALGAKDGDPLPKSKGDVEEGLEAIDGVVQARLEAFCCEEGNPVLYVGILERGSALNTYRPYPQEEVELPQEILTAYADFSAALSRASAEGDLKEDLTAYVDRDWSAEPFTRGCYGAHLPPGAWTVYGPALREPVGRIHWAGTETAERWTGYIDGAIDSGQRVAAEVLSALGG